ncbi:MAG: hypothetical protein K9K37_09275 [Desulfocapsa sp.]|nr:hypothetical protein [Desulfocapsa sp.]
METKKMMRFNRMQRRTRTPGNRLICLSMLLIGCFITLLPLNGEVLAEEKAGSKEIVIVSPPDGSFVTEKTAFLAGHVIGEKIDSVTITGAEVKEANGKVTVSDNTFGALVSFKKGINTLTIAGGGISKQVKIFYTPGDNLTKNFVPPKGFKRFYIHGKADPLTCTECHRKRRGKIDFKRITPVRSNCTTGNCHPKMGKDAAHVHGPVGAGVCISCHNPHGSNEPLQMARTGQELCLVCHEAKRKEFEQEVIHPPVEEGCVDCHDPHQSPMRFQLRGDSKRVSSLCFNCHEEEIFTKKHQHGPVGVGDCIACHFPHASANETLLIAPLKGGKLCFECHEGVKAQLAMKNTHKPVQEDCGKCHDPHSSDTRFQLVSPPKQLCKSCHLELSPDVYKAINTAKVQHEPVAKGECTKCHSPHGSEVTSLLKGKGINLCGTCHEDLGYDIGESKNLHGPVQTGSCSECHNVHGSDFSRLLVRDFPEEFYTSYKQEKYDLCFGCHNKDVATKKSTTKLTNFRDGDYNLHNFHVNRAKGRSCIACHDPHASIQPKHVRYEVPFGSWSYPIELTVTKTGGGCVVGCHAPKEYDRVKAVAKPSL